MKAVKHIDILTSEDRPVPGDHIIFPKQVGPKDVYVLVKHLERGRIMIHNTEKGTQSTTQLSYVKKALI